MKNLNPGPIILVFGTRPEIIKLAPVYFALKKLGIKTLLCSTAQHEQMLQAAMDVFGIKEDFNLKVMKPGQDLFYLTSTILERLRKVFCEVQPSLVVVQGDTTTTFSAALAAFYLQIPVAHVEAGLRTGEIYSPFPEEVNRKLVACLSSLNFCPTSNAVANLVSEGVKRESIFLVGNTVKDSLRIILEKIKSGLLKPSKQLEEKIVSAKSLGKKIVLLTTHRRESFDGGIQEILSSIKTYALENENVQFFYPHHLNPNVLQAMEKVKIEGVKNISCFPPVNYIDLVYLLHESNVIVTDSGGIQEEAACLNKPAIIVREFTDRPETIWAGLAKVVGTEKTKIINCLDQFLFGKFQHTDEGSSLYGDGFSAEKIARIIEEKYSFLKKINQKQKEAS